jgi:hypothetical protein
MPTLYASCTQIDISFFIFAQEITFEHGEVRSICTFDRGTYNEAAYQSIFFATSLAFPLLAIMWLYMNMLMRLWRGSAATHGRGPIRDKRNVCKGQENKKRVTKMIIIVIVAFAICWTPLQVNTLIFLDLDRLI